MKTVIKRNPAAEYPINVKLDGIAFAKSLDAKKTSKYRAFYSESQCSLRI